APALEGAAAVLNSIHGAPEAAGVRLAHLPEWAPSLTPTLPRSRVVKDLLAGNERASVYLAYRANPVYWSPRSESVRRAFSDPQRVDLLVAFDTHLTETAQLADLVLPAAADLELWNLFGGYAAGGQPYALLQQPVTRRTAEGRDLRAPGVPLERLFDGAPAAPLGEARQLGDALLELLALAGHPAREEFPYADCGAYVRHLADTAAPLAAAGGFAGLAREGVWVGGEASYPWASQAGFATPSGRLEPGARLVHQVPRDLKNLAAPDFALVVLSHQELGAGYANTRWGREIRHENPVYVNAGVARQLGLAAGDHVRLRTQVGEAVARVRPLEGLHPQAVALAEDFGHWAGGVAATARGEATGDEPVPLLVSRKGFLTNPLGITRQGTQPAQAPWWHHHGPGVSVSSLSPFTSDEHGAQTWRDLRVTIHPV
ncbi:MAG: molybdopterin dinucleotide binding domain-containing protein, partial [Deferrisomatales bacterium]